MLDMNPHGADCRPWRASPSSIAAAVAHADAQPRLIQLGSSEPRTRCLNGLWSAAFCDGFCGTDYMKAANHEGTALAYSIPPMTRINFVNSDVRKSGAVIHASTPPTYLLTRSYGRYSYRADTT